MIIPPDIQKEKRNDQNNRDNLFRQTAVRHGKNPRKRRPKSQTPKRPAI